MSAQRVDMTTHEHKWMIGGGKWGAWAFCLDSECDAKIQKKEITTRINAVEAFDVHRAVRMHLWYEQLAADHYEPDPLFEEDLTALKRYILSLDPEAL